MDTPKKIYMRDMLCDRIEHRDIKRVKELLELGADPNSFRSDGTCAVLLAAGAEEASDDLTRLVLDFGGDPNIRNCEGTTSVMIAASFGHCNSLRFLLDAGGNPFLLDMDGSDAFLCASESGCLRCVNILEKFSAIENYAHLNIKGKEDTTVDRLCRNVSGNQREHEMEMKGIGTVGENDKIILLSPLSTKQSDSSPKTSRLEGSSGRRQMYNWSPHCNEKLHPSKLSAQTANNSPRCSLQYNTSPRNTDPVITSPMLAPPVAFASPLSASKYVNFSHVTEKLPTSTFTLSKYPSSPVPYMANKAATPPVLNCVSATSPASVRQSSASAFHIRNSPLSTLYSDKSSASPHSIKESPISPLYVKKYSPLLSKKSSPSPLCRGIFFTPPASPKKSLTSSICSKKASSESPPSTNKSSQSPFGFGKDSSTSPVLIKNSSAHSNRVASSTGEPLVSPLRSAFHSSPDLTTVSQLSDMNLCSFVTANSATSCWSADADTENYAGISPSFHHKYISPNRDNTLVMLQSVLPQADTFSSVSDLPTCTRDGRSCSRSSMNIGNYCDSNSRVVVVNSGSHGDEDNNITDSYAIDVDYGNGCDDDNAQPYGVSEDNISFCSLHSVRICRRTITVPADTDEDSEYSLVETCLIPEGRSWQQQRMQTSMREDKGEICSCNTSEGSVSCSTDAQRIDYSWNSLEDNKPTVLPSAHDTNTTALLPISDEPNKTNTIDIDSNLSSIPSCNWTVQTPSLDISLLSISDDMTNKPNKKIFSQNKEDGQMCLTGINLVYVPPDICALPNAELRSRLLSHGESPGPITPTTRRTLELRLFALVKGSDRKAANQHANYVSEFKSEVMQALSGVIDITSLEHLEGELSEPFLLPDPKKNWREGIEKQSFIYLLLDPRLSCSLPTRSKQMAKMQAFREFLRAVFYIGKGKRSRPFEHFKEAASCASRANKNQPGQPQQSKKVQRIREIWSAGLGVVTLQIFNNIIPVEAYTREACMIDALGLDRLTNQCRGQFYGPASTWTGHRQRLAGLVLLNKAFNILLHEGERQIRLQDTHYHT